MFALPREKIQTDFAELKAGDWFLPMTIKDVNQHSLIGPALARGAAGFVFEEGQSVFRSNRPHFAVKNLREFLFQQAELQRVNRSTHCSVITGSAGKTSVKELLASILNQWRPQAVHISPENQNFKIALATQILRLSDNCKHAVFEMGARRVGDFLVPLRFIKPQVAALLNVGQAHIGEFGSLSNLESEKLSVLNADSVQTVVVPANDPRILKRALWTGKSIFTFGIGSDRHQDVTCHVKVVQDQGSSLTLEIHGQTLEFPCLGYHAPARTQNIAAAVAMALALDIPLASIHRGVSVFTGVSRRFEVLSWGDVTVVDDAFNASPESVEQGLYRMREMFHGQRILLVLGSMLELGELSPDIHVKVGRQIIEIFASPAESLSVDLAVVGQEALHIAREVKRLGFKGSRVYQFESSREARAVLLKARERYDVMYFKGAKALRLDEIFQ